MSNNNKYLYNIPSPNDAGLQNILQSSCSVLGSQPTNQQKQYCNTVCTFANLNSNQPMNCSQICQNSDTQSGCVSALTNIYQNQYNQDSKNNCLGRAVGSTNCLGNGAVSYGLVALPSSFQTFPQEQQSLYINTVYGLNNNL